MKQLVIIFSVTALYWNSITKNCKSIDRSYIAYRCIGQGIGLQHLVCYSQQSGNIRCIGLQGKYFMSGHEVTVSEFTNKRT